MIKNIFTLILSLVFPICFSCVNNGPDYEKYFNRTNIGVTEVIMYETNIIKNGNKCLLTVSKYYVDTNEMTPHGFYICKIRTNRIFACEPDTGSRIKEDSFFITNIDNDDSDELIYYCWDGGSQAHTDILNMYISKENKMISAWFSLYFLRSTNYTQTNIYFETGKKKIVNISVYSNYLMKLLKQYE